MAEHGGELIDQGHTHVRQLAQNLGLPLDDLLAAEQNGTEPSYYFDGSAYSNTQATNDLKAIWQQIHSDVSAASYPTLYNSSTQRGRELDAMSIADWIAAYVPGGRASKLGQLLDTAYNIEYGAECTQQSSLNMLYLGQIEPVLPGISSRWNTRATVDYWAGNPLTKGSYSYWKVGQYTKFSGAEGEQVGTCHFAGEHTSIDNQGYLEGAVETGQRAAGEILSALK